jgi:hypothetical protein
MREESKQMALRPRNKRAVGIFPGRRETESALTELRENNFPMNQVSVIARDSDRPDKIGETEVRDHVGNKADDGATTGALTGGALGGLTGLLVGLGALAIPGIGPIMLAGEIATAIATTLAGTAIGAATGGLIGALIGLGVPEEQAKTYNERVSLGNYLVIIDGTEDEIHRAETLLHRRGIENWGVFDIPASETRPRTDNLYYQRAIGVFPHRRDAETALDELIKMGFPPNQVYVAARDYDHHPNRHNFTVHNRFDNGFFGFLGDRNRFFQDRFDRGEHLVIVEGTPEELRSAETVLNGRGIQEWVMFKRAEGEQKYIPVAPTVNRNDLVFAHHKHGIGHFSNRREVEYALTELKNADFPMNQVSVVAHDSSPMDRLPGVNRMDRVDNYASLGVFEDRAKRYNDHVSQGHYLVIVNGTDQDIRRVQPILHTKGIQQFEIYDSTAVNPTLKNIEPERAEVINRDPKVKIVDNRERKF